mgnify:CR=1 FL=1
MKNELAPALLGALVVGAVALGTPTSTADADEDLSGRWVMVQVATTVADVPVIGEVYAQSRLITIHDLDHDGERLHGGGQICHLEIDSGSSVVETKLPAAFVRSLPEPEVDARVFVKDGRLELRQKKRPVVVGAELKKPKRERLPRDKDDERVRDTDGDGHPGVTIEIEGLVNGKIFVVQRSWTRLAGNKRVDGSFAGRLSFNNEQSILDATSSMLETAPETKPVPSRSWFRMAELPKGASCEDAIAKAEPWLP